jgi:hypothetical protein
MSAARLLEAYEDVWEYQRKGALSAYAGDQLLASDPRQYVDARTMQAYGSLDSVKLPQGQADWVWDTEWVASPWEVCGATRFLCREPRSCAEC